MRALLTIALSLCLGLAASTASAHKGFEFELRTGPSQTLEYNGVAPIFSGPPPLYWFDATITTLPNLHNGRVFITTMPDMRCWKRSNVAIGEHGCDPEYTDPPRYRLDGVMPAVATTDTWRTTKKYRLD